MSLFSALSSWLSRMAITIAAIGLVAMTAITVWQIIGRYFLHDSPNWAERLSIFLMNWYILLAAAAGIRVGFHLGLVFFRDAMRGVAKTFIELLSHLLVGGFGLAMIIYGVQLVKTTWTHIIPTLGISNAWAVLPVPIAGVLILLFSIEHILSRKEHPAGNELDIPQ